MNNLTRLEYLAGCALQGLMANPERYKYIAGLVDTKKLSQAAATKKNAEKALMIAKELDRQLPTKKIK
ncbi:MAG: hypothetical protein QM533_05015 [Cytophagales bacterium]|nr:hypothetical protein [Cytophagales bacterium]